MRIGTYSGEIAAQPGASNAFRSIRIAAVLVGALLMSSGPGEAQTRAPPPPCGGRLADMIAQQQTTRTGAALPCATPDGRAGVRHHDDAVEFDPAGGPAVFGSVAIPISRTPFDERWNRVRRVNLDAGGGPWVAAMAGARLLDRRGQLDRVNRWVNDHLGYAPDRTLHGKGDLWSPASTTLSRGRGDCEDYAIAKMALLASLGFRASNLFLVLVRDGARRADHAVLAVRENGRLYILDSTTNEVRESSDVPDYFPVMSFAAGRAWLHGYRVRREPAPLRVASTALHRDWSGK